jgi:RNA polymerase sigma factor (sigma-70 family)
MHLRRQRDHAVLSLDHTGENEHPAFENQLVDSEPNLEQVCEQSELRGIIQQVLELLSPRLRDALQLRDIDGLSTQEAAQVLGVTKGALKCRVQRARTRLTLLLPSIEVGLAAEVIHLMEKNKHDQETEEWLPSTVEQRKESRWAI